MRRAAVLVAALTALGAAGCSAPEARTLVAEFRNVGDLVPRANVQQSDAVVGTVSDIELDGWTAKVTMELRQDLRLPVGSQAIVRSTSLLGEKFVDLVPPAGAGDDVPEIPSGGTIPLERTSKAPEIEEVFSQLGAILASGALTDFGRFVSASAAIVDGQEENIGRVLDGTAKLTASLARQRVAIADALESLQSASATLGAGSGTVDRFLVTTDKAGRLLAEQRAQLGDLVVQLDRLGLATGPLMREHKDEMDRAIKALTQIVPRVFEKRTTLDTILRQLPQFAEVFAAAAPGDYIRLDARVEGAPGGQSVPGARGSALSSIWWSAAA